MLSSLRTIVSQLQKDGILDGDSAERALRSSGTGDPFSTILQLSLPDQTNTGRPLDIARLGRWLGDLYALDFVSINPLKIDTAKVTQVMAFNFANLHDILCVGVSDSEMVVATANPESQQWVSSLEQTTNKRVKRVVAFPEEIRRYRVEFYSLARSMAGAGKDDRNAHLSNFEQLLDIGKERETSADETHIINIVDWLLQYAFEQRASDIHLEPRRDIGRVRFRVDGVLHTVYEMPLTVHAAVVSRIKVLGRMNVAEKRRPQDGRIKTRDNHEKEIELRLSTMPTAFGEKMVMRIFDPEVMRRSFRDMGFESSEHEQWQKLIQNRSGILLVTGPTGSGKTSTLYTTMRQLATQETNVATVEDPIEMVVDEFNQSQIQPQIEFDFAAGIRTLMRQDPDIIMVGEIRDLETAEMAAQAALTGHLVLSTLHTNDAITAVTRLLDIGLPAHLVRATLRGVMAQRLTRKLCYSCRQPVEPDARAWSDLISPYTANLPKKMYQPKGCLECRNTGYFGREGIYEIVEVTPALSALISEDANLANLRKQAFKDGTQTLRMSGARKIASGKTTVSEVLRVTPAMDESS